MRRLKLYRGVWCAVWREDGRTRRISLRTTDRPTAERTLRDLDTPDIGETVGPIMEAYLSDLDQRATSPQRAHDAWKALKPVFGHLRPDQVTRPLCRAYVKQRQRQGRGNGTIGKELGVLRAGMRWADPKTPAVVELPAAPPPKDRYLTKSERDALVAGAEAFHVRLFIELAIGTAGRATAILQLTWDRVDFQRNRIQLSTGEGGRKGRATVPMNKRLRPIMEQAYEVAVTDHVVEWAGKPVGSIKNGIAAAARRAGLEDVSPHVLRHTAAVWMVEAGVPIIEVSQYLGHTDSRVTERVYGRFSPDYLAAAASALE